MFHLLSQAALDVISNPIGIMNLAGQLSHCNKAFLLSHQAQGQELIGLTIDQYLTRELAKPHLDADQQILHHAKAVFSYDALYCALSDKLVTHHKYKIFNLKGVLSGILHIAETHSKQEAENFTLLSDALTPKEKLILKQLTQGAPQKRIALNLGISPYTVNDYLKVIYFKLGVHSRSEAQVVAQKGFINEPSTCPCDNRACKLHK